MDALLSTLLILGLMALVVLVFRRVVRPPAKVSQEDPPGVRTVAIFCGRDPEFFSEDREDRPLVGVRLFQTLCDGLAERGVAVAGRGAVENAQGAECTVDAQRFGLVLEWVDGRWVASVEWVPETRAEKRHLALTHQVFAPRDSDSLRRLLAALDGWLKSHPKLSGVAWYRKEQWLREDFSDAAQGPLKDSVVPGVNA
jgi:hypothetical protein